MAIGLRIGTHTEIRVMIDDGRTLSPVSTPIVPDAAATGTFTCRPLRCSSSTAPAEASANKPPTILIVAIAMTVLIIVLGGIGFMIASRSGDSRPGAKTPPPAASRIPVRVIDPLGGEDEEDLDDLIASWETAEEEIKVENVADVSVTSTDADEAELNVTATFLAERQKKALRTGPGEKGIRPAGLDVPKELFGDGVIKQKAKLREMNAGGYAQPMDFAELAEKRLSGNCLKCRWLPRAFIWTLAEAQAKGRLGHLAFARTRRYPRWIAEIRHPVKAGRKLRWP
jgi:hypothetical protein